MKEQEKIFALAANIPVMLLGAPGIGKTAAITEFSKKMKGDLVDIRLSAETPSSFEGKDYISPQSGDLKKARAWWLRRINENQCADIPTILFFDEYTNATDALQQLAYAPFLSRYFRYSDVLKSVSFCKGSSTKHRNKFCLPFALQI